jgi:hypothetical protein
MEAMKLKPYTTVTGMVILMSPIREMKYASDPEFWGYSDEDFADIYYRVMMSQ